MTIIHLDPHSVVAMQIPADFIPPSDIDLNALREANEGSFLLLSGAFRPPSSPAFALCIIQARLKSTRLANKMLLTLPGPDGQEETLIARGYRLACEAFGKAHVVVAIPAGDEAGPLGEELRRIGADVFAWSGSEADVLGRFHACAHSRRWHPDSVIVRYTPDDHRRDPAGMRRVASGERLPVPIGGEAFTLAQLSSAHERIQDMHRREHLSYALFCTHAMEIPPGVWSIDTAEDIAAARMTSGR